MSKLKWILPVFIMLLLMPEMVLAMTAEGIIKIVDDNQYLESAHFEAEMYIVNGKRKMTKNMIVTMKGSSGLVEFTNARDRGVKFLKLDGDLWMFFPDAEEVVKISGHMLEDGMMGSDFSYQDTMESEELENQYKFTIVREEEVDGHPCYVLEGIANEDVEVSYYRLVSWIDKERFVILKQELYAQSGRLLKVMDTLKVEKIAGRWYITDSVMKDKLKKKSETRFTITSAEFDIEIPEDMFNLENLR